MYHVDYSKKARKELEKMDAHVSAIIYNWIDRNLQNCENPRQHGKALTGDKQGYWRYRVGDYRLIAEINDGLVTILMLHIGHRGKIY